MKKPLQNVSNPILIKAYEFMCTAKAITEVYEKNQNISSKYVHATSRGHEAIQIALGMQLEPRDWVSPYYRDDAMLLSLGISPYDLMLQQQAKKDDPFSGGRTYYSHPSLNRSDLPKIPHQSSATGMQAIPTAGAAMGIQYLENQGLIDKGSVVACSMGDGSLTEGEVSEALHMTALKQFPILFLIQDNKWDISASSNEIRSNDIVEYIKGYSHIKIIKTDGKNFINSYNDIKNAISIIRNERRPVLVYAEVPLLNHHTSGVRMEWYRDDIDDQKKNDPFPILQSELNLKKIDTLKIQKEIIQSIEKDFTKAVNAQDPSPDQLYDHIFQLNIQLIPHHKNFLTVFQPNILRT